MSDIKHWHHLTTTEVRQTAAQDPVVVLPVAALEQHGPHLPISTDLDIGMGLLTAAFDALPDDFPAWVLPPQAIGSSREHVRFPGTVSVEPAGLGTVIRAHGRALAACGVRRIVLSNSHGGNRSGLDAAALRLREEFGMLAVTTHYFLFARPSGVALPETEWRHGLHGGAIETAMMLHLRPDLVRTKHLRNAPSLAATLEDTLRQVSPEHDAASFAWLAGDLNRSGVTGNATLATAEIGAQLVAYYGARLAEVLLDAAAFPIDCLDDGGGETDS